MKKVSEVGNKQVHIVWTIPKIKLDKIFWESEKETYLLKKLQHWGRASDTRSQLKE